MSEWIKKSAMSRVLDKLPKTEMYSRDTIVLLLDMFYDEIRSIEKAQKEEQDFEDKHGPRWI